MPENKILTEISFWLLIAGGITWGLTLFSGFNLVQWVLSIFHSAQYSTWVYAAVGFAALEKIAYRLKILK
jgi:uncharacterized membrane protein YuzA (DUF378 family)